MGHAVVTVGCPRAVASITLQVAGSGEELAVLSCPVSLAQAVSVGIAASVIGAFEAVRIAWAVTSMTDGITFADVVGTQ